MKSLVIGLVLTTAVLGSTRSGAMEYTPGSEFGLGVGAAASNLIYTPAKVVVAVAGLGLGGMVGFLTGGDVRSAYAVLVPAASGTYFLTASNLDGSEPIEFFGSDYADTPSVSAAAQEAGGIYEAGYSMR